MRIFFILLAVLLLLVLPTVAAAQEVVSLAVPTASPDRFDQALEVLLVIGAGAIALMLIAAAIFVIFLLISQIGTLYREFKRADDRLITFGRSDLGKLVYQGVDRLYSSVDQATDPRIIQATQFINSWLKEAPALLKMALPNKDEALTEEDMANATRLLVGGLKELLNGMPLPDGFTAEDLFKKLAAAPAK